MHRCQLCGTLPSPHTRTATLVVGWRERTYPCRVTVAHDECPPSALRKKNDKKMKPEVRYGDHGGRGWEVVRELRVCAGCEAKLTEDSNGHHQSPGRTATG
jgi:hypothetical protein